MVAPDGVVVGVRAAAAAIKASEARALKGRLRPFVGTSLSALSGAVSRGGYGNGCGTHSGIDAAKPLRCASSI